MTDQAFFDEDAFPAAWRFNSPDCELVAEEKEKLKFLSSAESLQLWQSEISSVQRHLMKIDRADYAILKEIVLDFGDDATGRRFFQTELEACSRIDFFWGPESACVVPVDIFLRSWTDFFYPSDENSILAIPADTKRIFSFEEKFFVVRRKTV